MGLKRQRRHCPDRAKIAFNLWCFGMTMLPLRQFSPGWHGHPRLLRRRLWICGLAAVLCLARAQAQDDQLNKVHVAPPAASTPSTAEPAEAEAPAATGPDALKIHPGSRIRMNVDMVLVPVTVADPMNRLVTGLEREDFLVVENGNQQTSNPEDEFFVIGFNDRPELIEDFTSSVEDIQARLATVRSGHRTALLDAIYFGVAKMKDARHERKALLVVSDGGDNSSRYTEGEVRSQVRESDTEIYSIGIFDPYAPTPEERNGPQLLDDLSEETGGRLFRVDDIAEMGDIAEKISTELRNQYVIGYRPRDLIRDGKWRKVKVKVNPPQGLPPLTVHARTGYYAPLQ